MGATLISGIGGFVAGALTRRLMDDGETVVGLLRDHHGFQAGLWDGPNLHLAFGDVCDTDLVVRLLVDYSVTQVFHLAAQSAVAACQKDPVGAWRSNVLGTVSVLEAVRRVGRDIRICVSTSDKVYGDGPVPYREDQPLVALGTYSATKVAADILARDFAHTYDLDVSVIRSANVFGPGDLEFSRVIPGSIRRMLRGEPAILRDRNAQREFVYITDEVGAYLTVAAEGYSGEAYNVSGSGPVRIGDLMDTLAELCGGSVEVEPHDVREISVQYLDSSKLESLGWSPKVGLRRGLQQTVEWYRNYFGANP